MLHTFLLSVRLTRFEYDNTESHIMAFIKQMKSEGKDIKHFPTPNKTNRIYTYRVHPGIILRTIRTFGDYNNLSLAIEVNPATVFNHHDLITITSVADIPNVLDKVLTILKTIGISFPIDFYNVRRVDFAVNIDLKDDLLTTQYMSLLKKYRLPPKLSEKKEYSKSGRRYVTFPNCVYLTNDGICVNIYNKGDHLKVLSEKVPIYEPLIDIAAGIIRFEIQVKAGKLGYFKSRNTIASYAPAEVFTDELSISTLVSYSQELFLTGDYFCSDEAKNIVVNSTYKPKTKDMMIDFIATVARSSIREARKKLINQGIKEDKISRMFKKFNKIGLNPVIIPKAWGYKRIPNPINYLLNHKNTDLRWIKI